ncbi:MAG: ice-binding family protein [Polyangiaceae bacterium]
MKPSLSFALGLIVLPIVALAGACSDSDSISGPGDGGADGGGAGGRASAGATSHAGVGNGAAAGDASETPGGAGGTGGTSDASGAGGTSDGSDAGGTGLYEGPTVGKAAPFAALAYSSVTAANVSPVTGEVGVSAAAISNITGFDAATYVKYGIDSLAPNSQRTILAQKDVTALVENIDPRACDTDFTNVVGGLTGDVTLHPGVTCMNSFSADVLLNGHVTLDAGGDPNAFFVIRSNLTLTVADAAKVVLTNGAQACSVFWRVRKQVTIGKTVQFYGTIIAGTAITMKTGSTLVGRALAQTEGVMLDANTITIPTDAGDGLPGSCNHVQ